MGLVGRFLDVPLLMTYTFPGREMIGKIQNKYVYVGNAQKTTFTSFHQVYA